MVAATKSKRRGRDCHEPWSKCLRYVYPGPALGAPKNLRTCVLEKPWQFSLLQFSHAGKVAPPGSRSDHGRVTVARACLPSTAVQYVELHLQMNPPSLSRMLFIAPLAQLCIIWPP